MKKNQSINEYLAYHLPYYGVILFLIFNLIAMLMYPGGTYQDVKIDRYLFTQNYFSDLGRTLTVNGTPNFLSSFIFNNTLVIMGTLISYFYFFVPNLFCQNQTSHKLSKIGSAIAISSGIAFVGIGLTPSDLYLDAHIFFVKWAFRSFLIVAIIYIIAIFKASEWKNKYALIYVGFAVTLFLYILIMDFGPNGKDSIEGLIIQVVSQKIIAFVFVVSVYFKSMGAKEIYNQKSAN